MPNVLDVAKYILKQMEKFKPTEEQMTTLKLQKLVYYAQVWSLVWKSTPLFEEEIKAWEQGPVVEELFNANKGKMYLTSKEFKHGDVNNLTTEQKDNIDKMLKFYGYRDSQYLSDLTHMELPWKETRRNNSPESIITLSSIKSYYENL